MKISIVNNDYIEINCRSLYNKIVLGVKDFFSQSGFKKAVLGLSGGLDSAVVLAIAIEALGHENVDVLLLPTRYSSTHSIDDAIDMSERCKVKYQIVNIEKLRLEFLNTLKYIFKDTETDVTEENIQARIRGTVLMAYSNKFGNILLNTSNKSEISVGYSTMYGDSCGALSVIGDVYKTNVYKLADYINIHKNNIIPVNIITKPPSAELRPNQKDNDFLPDYEILDKILHLYIEKKLSAEDIIKFNNDLNEDTVKFVIKLVNSSEYKRYQFPPILRVSY